MNRYRLALTVVVVAVLCRTTWAEDRDLAFVHVLQARGMGDVAADYLQALIKQPDCPAEVKDLFDLEMSKSLRVQSQNIADPTDRAAIQAKSQDYLDKFIKLKPNHPEAVQAELSSAEMMFEQGKENWITGRSSKDKADQTAKLTEARKAYEQAGPLFKQVIDKLNERLTKTPAPARKPQGVALSKADKDALATRAAIEAAMIRARGEAALLDYYIAQTYTDVADNVKRKTALSTAAKTLDAIYQLHRDADPSSPDGRAALVAHVWDGKAREELGNRAEASAIYDEVLGNLPDPVDVKKGLLTGFEDVLAQAEHFSLLVIEKDQPAQYVDEANKFLTDFKRTFHNEWGYQAIEFELAKHLFALADKETKPAERAQLNKEAMALLTDMKGTRSEFQGEAILLFRERAKGTPGAEPKDVVEAIAFGDEAAKDHRWPEAEAYYRKALALIDPKKDSAKYSQVLDVIANCQLQPVYEAWEKWKKEKKDFDSKLFTEWADGAGQVARDNKRTDTALKAVALGNYFSFMLYVQAAQAVHAAPDKAAAKAATADKDAAVKRLQDLIDYTIKNFPGTAEADEARMSLARMKWNEGLIDEALAAFEAIDPKSDKYPEALQLAGEGRLQLYFAEMKKLEKDRDAKRLTENRTLALKHLADSIDLQRAKVKPGEAIPDTLINSVLLLAQVHVEGGEFEDAAKLLQPLVDQINKLHPAELDDTMLKVFGTIVRAYLGMNDFQKAGDAGLVLINLGPDKRDVNAVLVLFVQRLDIERKKLDIDFRALPNNAPQKQIDELRKRLLSINDLLSKMVSKLSERQELNSKSMYFVGKEFFDVEDFDNAERQFKAFQAKVAGDPDFAKEAGPLSNLVLTRLIDISQKKGNYEQAAEQAKKLREQAPKNLDVMITEAQIFQDWGEKKDPTKFDIAAAKWATIRNLLIRQKQNPKFADAYYDAVYNSAFCCLAQADKLQAKDHERAVEKAKEGEKILNSEMFLNKNLNGPLTVKRYKALLDKLQAFHKPSAPTAAAAQN